MFPEDAASVLALGDNVPGEAELNESTRGSQLVLEIVFDVEYLDVHVQLEPGVS